MNSVMFSSATGQWATPQEFFDKLNEEFHFTLDPCALPSNAKCERYFTPQDDGLLQNWGGRVCSATLHMAEQYTSGCVNVARNQRSLTLLSWLSFLLVPILDIFTSLYITKHVKYALSKAV